MQDSLRVRQFIQVGPVIDGTPLLKKLDGDFVSSHSLRFLDKSAHRVLDKIAAALNVNNFAEAAIRFAHIEDLIKNQKAATLFKANFDPSQPRNTQGKWSETNGIKVAITDSDGTPSVGYCKIVKQLCIAESTDVLPTTDYGMTFFRALNACMDRHGCLGVA